VYAFVVVIGFDMHHLFVLLDYLIVPIVETKTKNLSCTLKLDRSEIVKRICFDNQKGNLFVFFGVAIGFIGKQKGYTNQHKKSHYCNDFFLHNRLLAL
jgi:hypothetical protein